MIAVICPHCRRALSIPDGSATFPVACTACDSTFAAGIPIATPSEEWATSAPEPERESVPLHLRFQQNRRAAARGPGVFPVMALLFALFVPVGIGAVMYTAMKKPKTRPTQVKPAEGEADPLDPTEAGDRKAGGGIPVVEYKSLTEDPTLLENSRLETALPPPKADAAPPLFRGAKPNPKPRPQDEASTPKPPPP